MKAYRSFEHTRRTYLAYLPFVTHDRWHNNTRNILSRNPSFTTARSVVDDYSPFEIVFHVVFRLFSNDWSRNYLNLLFYQLTNFSCVLKTYYSINRSLTQILCTVNTMYSQTSACYLYYI